MAIEHTTSCGNVFADLGIANSDELLVKSSIAADIQRYISSTGLTFTEAATYMDITVERLTNILMGASLNTESVKELELFKSKLFVKD